VRSLRGADAAQSDSAPEERREAGGAPGSQKRIARGFVGQPPLIPHSTEGLDEITLEQSACVTCHGAESAKAAGAPAMTRSHYAQEKGKPTAKLDLRRHQCLSCHVPQFDAPPLVDNTFRGAR
jgi:cytochrome c-type protein NapB